jgi:hypothetical protein
MTKDAQGLAVTGSPDSAAAFDRAIGDFYGWKGNPLAHLQGALDRDPSFALGATMTAVLYLLSGFRGDSAPVKAFLTAAEAASGGATQREKRHLEAAKAWATGAIFRATEIWEDILLDYPKDALALRFAHNSYYYLGHSQTIRDSVARVLPFWDTKNPNYGFVLGQNAFGLEEAGELGRAEKVARDAIALNAEDAWAVHALAHVMEEQSRQREGIEFLKASHPNWSRAQTLSVHNGWHLALYLIEEGRFEEVLADYDRFVAPRIANDFLMDMIDASALLWRLELAGADVGARWEPLARQWANHLDDHVLAFNDLHLALAIARGKDRDDVQRFRASLDRYERDGLGDNHAVTVEVGRRLVDGALAFAEGDYKRVIERILPVRYQTIRIGGSHAQRDIVAQTLIAAAERAGETKRARALLAERLAQKPTERVKQAYARLGGATARHTH